jgi:flagellar operon protein
MLQVDGVPLGHTASAASQPQQVKPHSPSHGTSFAQELTSASLRFSKHARERLERRGITVGPEELQRVHNAVELAATKGAVDSLVLLDRVAFLVNVRSRTIVTALEAAPGANKVFTNIDSVVVA